MDGIQSDRSLLVFISALPTETKDVRHSVSVPFTMEIRFYRSSARFRDR